MGISEKEKIQNVLDSIKESSDKIVEAIKKTKEGKREDILK